MTINPWFLFNSYLSLIHVTSIIFITLFNKPWWKFYDSLHFNAQYVDDCFKLKDIIYCTFFHPSFLGSCWRCVWLCYVQCKHIIHSLNCFYILLFWLSHQMRPITNPSCIGYPQLTHVYDPYQSQFDIMFYVFQTSWSWVKYG